MKKKFAFEGWIKLLPPYPYEFSNKTVSSYPSVWTVSSNAEFWEILYHLNDEMEKLHLDFPNRFWFRGQTSSKYVLLPSLIRSYFQNGISCSLPKYQRMLLESFITESKGAPEFFEQGGGLKIYNEQIEHLANMQHYSIPTNLMDWSEDVSVALYFATHINKPTKVALYVFQPYFYNFVRRELIQLYRLDNDNPVDVANRATANPAIGSLLPNLSAHFNVTEQRYTNYITGPSTFEDLRKTYKWRKHNPLDIDGLGSECAPLFPLAVQIPRNNYRIKNQSGAFLAFNLCEFPFDAYGNNDILKDPYFGFQHIELEQVQRFYMNSEDLDRRLKGQPATPGFEAMRKKAPFLWKLEIHAGAAKELQEMVSLLGKREDSIYPELFRVGERISADARGL